MGADAVAIAIKKLLFYRPWSFLFSTSIHDVATSQHFSLQVGRDLGPPTVLATEFR